SALLHRPLRSTLFPYTTLFRSIALLMNLRFTAKSGTGLPRRTLLGIVHVRAMQWRECVVQVLMNRLPFKASGGDDVVAQLDGIRSEEHTSELQSLRHLVCRLLL